VVLHQRLDNRNLSHAGHIAVVLVAPPLADTPYSLLPQTQQEASGGNIKDPDAVGKLPAAKAFWAAGITELRPQVRERASTLRIHYKH